MSSVLATRCLPCHYLADVTAFYSVASLPLPLLIALIYRITVLHAASRIIIFIRKRTTGWEEPARSTASTSVASGESEAARGVFWNGQKLSEEPPVSSVRA